MIDFRNYEALTFDCYGTLIDWEKGILTALRELRREHDLRVSDDDLLEKYARAEAHVQRGYYRPYREVLHEVMKKVARQYQITLDADDEDLIEDSLPSWKPFPDTVQGLQGLGRYFRLGIISNIDDDLFALTARSLDVPFDWTITAQQVGAYKPAHRMFRRTYEAMELDGIHPSRVVHVAQSRFHDIAPVNTLGGTTVWVNRRGQGAGHGATGPDAAEADLVVSDLAVLLSLVQMQLGEPEPRRTPRFTI